jgi:hypothetical protein
MGSRGCGSNAELGTGVRVRCLKYNAKLVYGARFGKLPKLLRITPLCRIEIKDTSRHPSYNFS